MIINYSKFNNHWETKTLNDLGTFRRGKSKHRPRNDSALFENGEYPLIQTGEIKDANLYINSHKGSYNEFGLKQSKLWNKGTLCITIAANIAETAILNYPMCFPDSVVGFNAFKDKSSEIFIHYVITYIRKAIQNAASGSIQDNINIDYLTSLKFKIPTKQIQDKIAAILSALDDKIELNNQINTELEAMAKTLYDYWFVQFDFPDENGKPYQSSGGKMVFNGTLKREIPVGWEVKKLSAFAKTGSGGTPKSTVKEYYENGQIPWINSGELNQPFIVKTENFISEIGLKNSSAKLFPKQTILMAMYGATAGKTSIISFEATTNQAICAVMPLDKIMFYYTKHVLDDMYKYLINLSTGSARDNLSQDKIRNLDIVIPSEELSRKFCKIVTPFFRKIEINLQENQELAQLRDWLLPMLMNGQVSVK